MPHVTIRDHRGKTVVETRFPRGADLITLREILSDAGFVYAQIPHGQVLALVDFDGQVLGSSEMNLIEAVAKANADSVQATALLGVHPTQRALFEEVMELMHRNGRIFDEVAAALDWLVEESNALEWLLSDAPAP